ARGAHVHLGEPPRPFRRVDLAHPQQQGRGLDECGDAARAAEARAAAQHAAPRARAERGHLLRPGEQAEGRRHDGRHVRPQLDGVGEGHPAPGPQDRHRDRRMDGLAIPPDAGRELRALQRGALPMTPFARHRSRGFSTAEVLIGTALSLAALGTLYSFFQAQQKSHATQSTYSQSQTITRTVIDLMTREIRMATYDPTAPTPAQRDCVTKVRVTVKANLKNPNPRVSTPVSSIAECEVAIRNRSLMNF